MNLPTTSDPTDAERTILAELIAAADQSVIDSVVTGSGPWKQVVVLMQSTHLDWNWLVSNVQYFRQGTQPWNNPTASVASILESALALVSGSSSAPAGQKFAFSLAEVGFLMQYVSRNPAAAAQFAQCAPFFSLIGGAIETPDDLLPHGEAFIRTYLLTRLWAEQTVPGTLSNYAWLPDDFGHTPDLPITYEAMGFEGFGFSRVPGSPQGQNNGAMGPALVMQRNVDFLWSTPDGSSTQAHYMQDTYGQGSASTDLTQLSAFLFQANRTSQYPGGGNALAVRSPYVMIPFGDDFTCPVGTLLSLAQSWNAQPSSASNGVYAVLGTVDNYMALVAAWNARSAPNGLQTLSSPLPNVAAGATF